MDAPSLPFEKSELAKLQKLTKGRELFLAASTHPGEERLIARLHQKLRLNHPDLLTIIVPRHPNRNVEICKLLKEDLMIATTIRSQNEKITDRTDIYLADTLGELGLFYSLSDIAFIGGSLVEIGGHNPIEAIKLGSIVISGQYCHNFHDMYQHLQQDEAVIKVDNEFDLESEIYKLFTNTEYKKSLLKNSQKFVSQKSNILNQTVTTIAKFL